MKYSETCFFKFLAPTTYTLGTLNAEEVKRGPGILRYVWVMNEDFPSDIFNVWDGTITQSQSPIPGTTRPPTINGKLLFFAARGTLGPMWLTFDNGLVVQYRNNAAQTSGFVSFQ